MQTLAQKTQVDAALAEVEEKWLLLADELGD